MEEQNYSGDMPSEEFKKIGYQLIDWISNYIDNIESYPPLAQVKPGEVKSKIPKSFPETGESLNSFLDDVNKIIIPGLTHWQHPNFMAYFSSTACYPGILGELLTAALNTNGMVWKSNPASTELEETVVDWFRQMIGLEKSFKGIVYDTASVSTMHAIAAAREKTYPGLRNKGMGGAPRLRLYCTEHTHSSIEKGAITLGIGLEGVRKIKVDENFSMVPQKLQEAIIEDRANGWISFCTVATIGTTSMTSVDPIDEIADICKKENIWLHVDGAYAGVTALLPEMKHFFKGIEKADSFVVNPHKWLFVPLDFSLLYISEPEILKRAFSLIPEYLKTAEDTVVENYMDFGIQLGRRFRSLKFWLVLRYFGAEGLRIRIREHVRLGKLFSVWIIKDDTFELMAPVHFSTVCFRFKPEGFTEFQLNELNEKLMKNINATGKIFLSHTKLYDKFTIRLVAAGLRTEEKHIKLAWEIIQQEAKKLL